MKKWPNGQEYWDKENIYTYADKRLKFLDTYYEELYNDTISDTIYEGVDYSSEFDTRYYWEKNMETLQPICTYNKQELLEHYALYGKPFSLKAKMEVNN